MDKQQYESMYIEMTHLQWMNHEDENQARTEKIKELQKHLRIANLKEGHALDTGLDGLFDRAMEPFWETTKNLIFFYIRYNPLIAQDLFEYLKHIPTKIYSITERNDFYFRNTKSHIFSDIEDIDYEIKSEIIQRDLIRKAR